MAETVADGEEKQVKEGRHQKEREAGKRSGAECHPCQDAVQREGQR